MYSTAFWCLIVVYCVFWLYCVTTVTPFIERSAYQLICIMTISTYTTDDRAEMTRQLSSCIVKKRVLTPVV